MANYLSILISNIKKAITELKEVDAYITDISNANDSLLKSDLQDIINNAFEAASKYGKTAANYLSDIKEAFHNGYNNAKEIAELSMSAQNAGNMTADLTNKLITTTDKAYKMNGSITELTKVLDGMNYISNSNSINMTDLAEGMTNVASVAASLGVDANKTTSALATMIAATNESGSDAARAYKDILLNIRQITDEEEGINTEGLAKYKDACNALNVSLEETVNGVRSLRNPMTVLKELSVEYNKLDETDTRKSNLLNSIGNNASAAQLDALLRNWDTYETILTQYRNGTGSMAEAAEKTASSFANSLNRLSNTWTDTIGNIANSNEVIGIIDTLDNLLSIIDNMTDKFGALNTIFSIGGGIIGTKQLGYASI